MKERVSFLLVILMLVAVPLLAGDSTTGSGGGGGTTTPVTIVDAEQSAREYAVRGVTVEYRGDFNSVVETQTLFGVDREDERCNYVIRGGQIVYCETNGTVQADVSRGDKPLPGFIPPTNGGRRTNVNFWVSGFNKLGEPTVYGQARYEHLATGQPIVVTIIPASMRKFVARFATIPKFASVRFYRSDGTPGGGNGWYDEYRDGFWLWVEPFQTAPPTYQIYDQSTDIVYVPDGSIGFLPEQVPAGGQMSAISFMALHGVQEIDWHGTSHAAYERQELTGETDRQGSWVGCKVFWTDVEGLPLFVRVYGLKDAKIEIRDVDTGEIFLVSGLPNEHGTVYVNDMVKGFGLVIITIRGTGLLEDYPNGWTVVFIKDGQNSGKG